MTTCCVCGEIMDEEEAVDDQGFLAHPMCHPSDDGDNEQEGVQ